MKNISEWKRRRPLESCWEVTLFSHTGVSWSKCVHIRATMQRSQLEKRKRVENKRCGHESIESKRASWKEMARCNKCYPTLVCFLRRTQSSNTHRVYPKTSSTFATTEENIWAQTDGERKQESRQKTLWKLTTGSSQPWCIRLCSESHWKQTDSTIYRQWYWEW